MVAACSRDQRHTAPQASRIIALFGRVGTGCEHLFPVRHTPMKLLCAGSAAERHSAPEQADQQPGSDFSFPRQSDEDFSFPPITEDTDSPQAAPATNGSHREAGNAYWANGQQPKASASAPANSNRGGTAGTSGEAFQGYRWLGLDHVGGMPLAPFTTQDIAVLNSALCSAKASVLPSWHMWH